MSAPLPDTEQQLFELRQHILPSFQGDPAFPIEAWNEEVVEMLWVTVEVQQLGLNYNVGGVEDVTLSRVWQYASGRFGFGAGPDGRVVDFRPICIKDNLADVVDLSL